MNNTTAKGKLVVVSGPSGVGKDTVVEALLAMSDKFVLSVSATTRAPRGGETDGINYFFKTTDEFESMIAHKQLLEYANYGGNFYGTPKAYVEEQLEQGKHVILVIDTQGALQVRDMVKEAVLIFIAPESAEILKKRLEGRGTETPDKVAKRIAIAEKELHCSLAYDYIVINKTGKVEDCAKDILSVVHAESLRSRQQFQSVKDFYTKAE